MGFKLVFDASYTGVRGPQKLDIYLQSKIRSRPYLKFYLPLPLPCSAEGRVWFISLCSSRLTKLEIGWKTIWFTSQVISGFVLVSFCLLVTRETYIGSPARVGEPCSHKQGVAS
jgi:hypothetical protein